MNLVEIRLGEFVEFQWMDKTPGGSNLGRAEFQICQIYKRGKLSEVFIYPRQQRTDVFYHAKMNGENRFSVRALEGLSSSDVWMFGWCNEHKTITMSLYVPSNSKYFHLEYDAITFTKTRWDN